MVVGVGVSEVWCSVVAAVLGFWSAAAVEIEEFEVLRDGCGWGLGCKVSAAGLEAFLGPATYARFTAHGSRGCGGLSNSNLLGVWR